MTLERTIRDLVEDMGDLSLAADALRDADSQHNLDNAQLQDLLAPLAMRKGFSKSDGAALLASLQQSAGTDDQSTSERILANQSLTLRVLSNYAESLSDQI